MIKSSFVTATFNQGRGVRKRAARPLRAKRAIRRGTELDDDLTDAVRTRKPHRVLDFLRENKIRITDAQQTLRSSKYDVQPVADLLGSYKSRKAVVEVKCSPKDVFVSHATRGQLAVPFDSMRDTWKNRAMLQAAIQAVVGGAKYAFVLRHDPKTKSNKLFQCTDALLARMRQALQNGYGQ